MTTEQRSTPPRAKETCSERNARQQLILKQIQDAVDPVRVEDMTDIAASLMVLGIMQMWKDKETALRYLARCSIRMGDLIEQQFDTFKQDTWVQ